MSDWDALTRELDAWGEAGRIATLWWRDDDAVEPTPALAEIAALADALRIPLALAVIPDRATRALAEWLADRPRLSVLQHGYAHQNHAPGDERKAELEAHRPEPVMLGELGTGLDHLGRLLRRPPLPVLVPPWNRIAPRLMMQLTGIGLRGLSTFGPRLRAHPCGGLLQVNCHLDPVDWRGSGGFAGSEAMLARAVGHLSARREGRADAAEATGLLTHHLVQDLPGRRFLSRFLETTSRHPAARWIGAEEIWRMPA